MNEWTSGMNTTAAMWQYLSECLDGSALPESLNKALYALCKGEAAVVPKTPTIAMIENAVAGDPLSCDVPPGDVAMIYGRIWDFMLSATNHPNTSDDTNTPTR